MSITCTYTKINEDEFEHLSPSSSMKIMYSGEIVEYVKNLKNFQNKKKYKSKKLLPKDIKIINNIPCQFIKLWDIVSSYVYVNQPISVSFGLMFSETLKNVKPNHLVPYVYLECSDNEYINDGIYIRISLLNNKKMIENCYVEIEADNINELYACFDYIDLDKLETYMENGTLTFVVTYYDLNTKDIMKEMKYYAGLVEEYQEEKLQTIDNMNKVCSDKTLDNLFKQSSIEELNTFKSTLTSLMNNVEDTIKKKKEAELLMCNICCDNKIDTIFMPCGHTVACGECCKIILEPSYVTYDNFNAKCPICKQYINTTHKIYLN